MRNVRVGIAQYAPKFLNKEATIEKACKIIETAGKKNINLLVFPETFIAAFPYWRGSVSVCRSTELIFEMQKNAIKIPSDDTDTLSQSAKKANIICVIALLC